MKVRLVLMGRLVAGLVLYKNTSLLRSLVLMRVFIIILLKGPALVFMQWGIQRVLAQEQNKF